MGNLKEEKVSGFDQPLFRAYLTADRIWLADLLCCAIEEQQHAGDFVCTSICIYYGWSRYSGGQKFLNDHSIENNFFVCQPIDLKFWSKLHITIIYFLANLKVWCFLAEVMILRVSLSKSKV
jgi:hypothetical protein